MHIPSIVIPLAASVGVYIDAKAIGVKKGLVRGFFDMGAGMWGLACFLLLIIALPAYLLKRGEYQQIIAQNKSQAILGQEKQASSEEVWPPPPTAP